MTDSTRSLLSTFDHVWSRLLARLDGLSDEEYLWEPPGPYASGPPDVGSSTVEVGVVQHRSRLP